MGLASVRILEENEWDSSMTVEGFTPAKPDHSAEPYMNSISPSYFATLGVPIVAGRDFRIDDNHEVKHGPEAWNWVPTTVMINEKFAKRFFPGRNPIGLHVGFGTDPGTPTGRLSMGLAIAALAIVACAAGYVPALRASRLDPMAALRYE